VGELQNEDDASLKHAMDLASGMRVQKIFERTMGEAFTMDALEYIGGCTCEDDPNSNDILQFHASLLLTHIGCLFETSVYHQSYPWKLVLFLRSSWIPGIVAEMRSLWEFVTTCVDTNAPKSQTYKNLAWTRAQCFRECFVVAESLSQIIRTFLSLR